MLKTLARNLPDPIVRKLRLVRDQFAIRSFNPRIVEHVYGGVPLRIKIADKMSASWYDHDFEELPEITFLKKRNLKRDALCFDLGAHQGVIALMMAKMVGDSGRVIAVEASSHNFAIATENQRLNNASNLMLVKAAIAEIGGTAIPFTGGINGSVSSTGDLVSTVSIDGLVSKYGIPDVVMLDIEGYECQALNGASQTLQSGPNWYIEVHGGCGLEAYGGNADTIVRTFRSYGYKLYFQTDEHYRDQFRAMEDIPQGRFFLIAVKE
jgi:FkbM family methyltransferase